MHVLEERESGQLDRLTMSWEHADGVDDVFEAQALRLESEAARDCGDSSGTLVAAPPPEPTPVGMASSARRPASLDDARPGSRFHT